MLKKRLLTGSLIAGLLLSTLTPYLNLNTSTVIAASEETYVMPEGAFYDMEKIEVVTPEGYELNDTMLNLINAINSEDFTGNYYDQLDDDSKTVYDVLLETYKDGGTTDTVYITEVCKTWENVGFYKSGNTITGFVDSDVQEEMLTWAINVIAPSYLALEYDHPELAWISGVGFYSGYGVKSFSFTDNGDGTYSGDMPVYVACSIANISADVDSDYVSDLISMAMDSISGTNNYQLVKSIYDYIKETASYAESNATDLYYQTSVSALTGETVCTGYSRAFKMLCDQVDIPCVVINGNAGIEAHAWNYVYLNNNWYAVDLTWCDYYDSDKWFLNGSDTFSSNHTEDGAWDSAGEYAFVYPTLSTSSYSDPDCTHDYDCTVVSGTCVKEETYIYICSLCGDTYEEYGNYDANNHGSESITYEGDCTEGLTEIHTCDDCKKTITTITLDPQEHTFVNGVCTVCGTTEDSTDSTDSTEKGDNSNDSETGTTNDSNTSTSGEGTNTDNGTGENTNSGTGNEDISNASWTVKLSACDISLSKTSYTYTGKKIKPTVTVTYNNEVINSNYYTVTYKNNKNAGTGTVTITGKMVDDCGCSGAVTTTFKIKKAAHKNVKITLGSTYSLGFKGTSTKTSVAKVVSKKIKAKKVGVCKIKSTNYKTFKVTVIPKKISIKKTWRNGSKLMVTINKNSSVTGYEVQCSTSKKFTKVYSQKVKGQKLTMTFTNLNKNKTYYVRVRTYKTVNGKKYYSKWSKVSKVASSN